MHWDRRKFLQTGLGTLASTSLALLIPRSLSAGAASVKALEPLIDQVAKDYFSMSNRKEASLIIGATMQGERYLKGFKSPGAVRAYLPDARTVYEIGSISKVSTTTLLAKLEADGVLALEDTIAEHLPFGDELSPEIASITLRQLATHTSGLQRVPPSLFPFIEENVHTCYARYTKEHLYKDLRSIKLAHERGTRALYSIMGMGTLGHIVELRGGKPYDTLVEEFFSTPLGLEDTTTRLSAEQQRRVAIGYDHNGNPVPNWDHDVLAPQGALRSTAHDMMRFAEANARVDHSPLSAAMQRTQQRHFEGAGGTWGLGWWKPGTTGGPGVPVPDVEAWMHTGATGAYRCYLGVCPAFHVGVFALASDGDTLSTLDDLPSACTRLLPAAVGIAST